MKRWNNEAFYFISKELYIALLLETHRSLHYTTKHQRWILFTPQLGATFLVNCLVINTKHIVRILHYIMIQKLAATDGDIKMRSRYSLLINDCIDK